ncbi:putative cytoplasmic dynein heavy chain 2 [Acaromyces ingoldii]|uniref:Dynein heavy chain, cytoplasmic n=1 Tax=Acaromyces ingoldii TaxID=215250 RepID=A0A316YHD9_9BASI|nr:putative cytoplasmic dynein heavy chain 2 [Acaromyces ingoldii]PWN87523.1 putative cytoplasmic dynein heavy chain 2 [Acaromyces ingoldii]
MPVATGTVATKVPGDWAPSAYRTVAAELTASLDLGPSAPEVIDTLVHVHFSVYQQAERLKRRQGRRLQLGPRSFLDLIHHYVGLSDEKREGLEEEQRHLNVGLDKLKETVEAVSELQKSLAVKRTQLEAKNAEANEKLQRMVADQKQAEEQKAASIEIQSNLERQEKEIGERREVVMKDLADAEPAVQEAQSSVSNIKKQHLTEVRSMGNPPAPVKNTMESVCIALGHRVDSWKTVQGIIRRDDFISSIVNFDTDRQMTRTVREKMKRDYLSKPDYNYETISRASKACGPLAKWVIAQVHFSEILDRVGPLRDEVDSLENQAQETKEQAGTIVTMISELEASIGRYKDEYAALISETQSIKSEMERVQRRVDRSIQLLDSLGSEKERWEAGSRTFDTQMSTIVGDALLSAAFLTYAGFFDQQYRESMWHGWVAHLQHVGVKFKPELSFADYLSTADDRLGWQSKSLPADILCTENAIMLQRFKRFPLIIDPSGQATTFLTNEYRDRKLTVTSFLDEAFLKNLESALRFGNPLLIQDVEHLDPIINPVLNGELRKTGGRVLIRLGSQEIDYSPSFTMFLSTRDPSVEFTPDVCSRVTFVNFTMTRGSLQSQSLDQVLKSERPDTDKKRTDLMKLQGEFRLRLRHLEKSLLNALNESKGNILDDDKVIDTLETLKKEAAEVTSKVEETDAIMQEVDEVTQQYIPLAKACSSLFFVLDQLNLVNHFYQFSLRFFLDIFDFVLRRNPNLQGVTDPKERLNILTRDLFLLVYKRTNRALMHHDHVMLAMLLAQIWAREGDDPDAFEGDEFDFLLEGGDVVGAPPPQTGGVLDELLNVEQRQRLTAYKRLALFRSVEQHIEGNGSLWRAFLESNSPENEVPVFWEAEGSSQLSTLVRKLLVVKCLRPDRVIQAMTTLVNTVFATDILSETAYDLQSIVSDEVGPQTPVALCSVPGFDASYRVDGLVRATGTKCNSVAMGSQEGFSLADQAIAAGARAGHWVLLKNVHLAPSWLSQLEKKMLGLNANRNFRLFLTCETNPVIPVNFLRASRILMNEPPPGLRANMMDSLRSISPSRLQKGPAEVMRLFFLLSFFHATLTERLRYTPLGWSKAFEFNDSDAETALDTIEAWVGRVAKGRSNVDPASIPWDALRSLLKQSIYGGKIDNGADQILLDSFVDGLFTPRAYEQTFALVEDKDEPLIAPEGTKMDQFMAWVQKLPDQQPPQWLALPPTAERVIATAQGAAVLSKLVKMRQLADDDDDEPATPAKPTELGAGPSNGHTATAASAASQQPAWMKALYQNAKEWLEALPKEISTLKGTSDSIANPLFRFWAREHRQGSQLLKVVRQDLLEVMEVCLGEKRQTNHNRQLLNDLPKGIVPANWRQYPIAKTMTLGLWISDLAQRLAQLQAITTETRFELFAVTLGLLFSPGAYLTATRQAVAHRTRVSLENLKLDLRINNLSAGSITTGFTIKGLKLEGADWQQAGGIGSLKLNDGATTLLDDCTLVWIPQAEWDASRQRGGAAEEQRVPLSVYLNADRQISLFHIDLPATKGLKSGVVAQRAVALRAA